MARPIDPRVLGVVVAGGAVGVFARGLIVAPVTDAAVVPWTTLGINLAGALLLGVVVGWLGDRRPVLRAFLGTGVLGGFTTYSAFAVATAVWVTTPLLAAGLAAASVIGGVIAALAGLWLGRLAGHRVGGVDAPEVAE